MSDTCPFLPWLQNKENLTKSSATACLIRQHGEGIRPLLRTVLALREQCREANTNTTTIMNTTTTTTNKSHDPVIVKPVKRAKIQVQFKPKAGERKTKFAAKEKVRAAKEWVLKAYPTVLSRLAQ